MTMNVLRRHWSRLVWTCTPLFVIVTSGCGVVPCLGTAPFLFITLNDDGFEETLATLLADAEDRCETAVFWHVAQGTCMDSGLRYLAVGGGFTRETIFFEPDTGRRVGYRHNSDAIDLLCDGMTHWPWPVTCDSVEEETVAGCDFEP